MLNWRDKLKQETKIITQKCNYNGWDGYDAVSINQSSLEQTLNLIDLLPNNIQTPEISPEPSGNMALEWHPRENLILSISACENKISYAAILENKKINGEEYFAIILPKSIEEILLKYFIK